MFLSLLKRPVNCVRVLLTKVNAMACEYSCESCTEKAQCGWYKPDLTWTWDLSLLKEARTHKTFNWLPMAYWKCHVWPDNIVLQKAILYSLMQLSGLSQMNKKIHPVKQTFSSENYSCEMNLCQNAAFSGSTEKKALLKFTNFKKKWTKPGQMQEGANNKMKETSGEYSQLCFSG